MPNKITIAFRSFFNLLFPKVCLGCEAFLLPNEIAICTSCRHEMPLTNHHQEPKNEIIKKFYGRIDLEFGASLLYFHKKGIVQQLIHNLKYNGHQEIGTIVGKWLGENLNTLENRPDFDVIIPVPLHKKRLKQRGFNQVETFGNALSESLKIEYDDRILHRNFHSKTQTRKNFFGRTEVKQDLFGVEFSEADHSKHFLLIDDVITSGATIEACAKALQKIPGARVSVISMAYSHS